MAALKIQKIGKYDVLEIIGRGGMGVVFKATDPLLGRLVAIKMMTGGFFDDPDLLKRFYREAQGTASLHHPNIVTVYDMGDQDGNPYLVMEFLEGESLDSIIRSRRELSLLDKTNYVVQVCRGLGYAHERSIVHRDIKPANIMILPDGAIKIVDFGIARMGNDRVTKPGQVMGSVHYMSPEQICERDVDACTDMFATGVVLYQLLTYELPFKADDVAGTLLKIIHDPPTPLSNYLPDCPPEFEYIIERALAKDKEDRYQSADEFAFDLLQVQAQLKHSIVAGMLAQAEPFIAAGDLAAAKEQLLKALKVDPQDATANERMREVLHIIQRRRRQEQAQQLRTQAEQELVKNDFDQALRFLDQAVSLDQTNSELQDFKSQVSEAKVRADEIRNAMRGAGTARKDADFPRALQLLARVLELKPDHPPAVAMRSDILREMAERQRQERLQALVAEAQGEISSRRFKEALETVKRIEEFDPRAPQLRSLTQLASDGLEQERRGIEIASFAAAIQHALDNDDFASAEAKASESLRKYPSEDSLLNLRAEAKTRRELLERQKWIDQQIAGARQSIDAGDSEAALVTLERAVAKYPEDPSLGPMLESVRETVARERVERHKARIRQDATTAVQRKAFDEAIAILEGGKAELGTAEFDQLIGIVHAEAEAEARRRKIETVAGQAATLIQQEEYDDAIAYLQTSLIDVPDEQLQHLLADVRSRADERRRRVAGVVATARDLITRERPDEAIALLRQESGLYAKFPELKREWESAQRKREWLAEIELEKSKVLTALSRGDLETSEATLRKCEQRFGARTEFAEIDRQIQTKRAAFHSAIVSKAVATATTLSASGSFSAAVQSLAHVAESLPFLSPDSRREYDNAVAAANEGVERKRRDAEVKARLDQQQREADEQARREAEQRRKTEAEDRARQEAEERERIRVEREREEEERKQAVLRAAKEQALRDAEALAHKRELLERRKKEKKEEEEPRVPPREGSGPPQPDTTLDVRQTRWEVIRGLPTHQAGSSPLAKRGIHDTSVSELTPPEGLRVSEPTQDFSPRALLPQEQPSNANSDTGKVELPVLEPPAMVPEIVAPARKARHTTVLVLVMATFVLIAAGAGIWLLLRSSPADVAVQFTTFPAGVQIRVGSHACVAPCSMRLPAGSYDAEAQREGYAPATKAFSVGTRGHTEPVAIAMQPLPPPAGNTVPNAAAGGAPVSNTTTPEAPPAMSTGTLAVRANVEGASVVVNNRNYGTISGGILRLPLEPKAYKISVEKDGFKPAGSRSVTILKGRESDVAFELKPVAPSTVPNEGARATGANASAQAASTPNGTAADLTPPSQPSVSPPPVAAPAPPPKPVDEAAQVWARISNSRNRGDFEDFHKRFPGSSYSDQAATKLNQLDWEAARQKNSPEALQAYLTNHPNGAYSDLARQQLKKLEAELQHNSEREAIISVLKRFEASYNDRDAERLAAVWPTLPKKELNKYRESFKAAQSVHMRLNPLEPQINGDVASVKCGRYLQFVFKQDVQPARQDEVTIQLRKTGANWVIESAR